MKVYPFHPSYFSSFPFAKFDITQASKHSRTHAWQHQCTLIIYFAPIQYTKKRQQYFYSTHVFVHFYRKKFPPGRLQWLTLMAAETDIIFVWGERERECVTRSTSTNTTLNNYERMLSARAATTHDVPKPLFTTQLYGFHILRDKVRTNMW